MSNDLCTFIISHQRPDNVKTYDAFRRAGYTGDIYIVCDDKDPTLDTYYDRFGDEVIVFSKDAVATDVDLMDLQEDQQTSLYAREKVWDLAEDLGVDYFMLLDDDYDWFGWRIGPDGRYLNSPPLVENMDAVLEVFMQYMNEAPIDCLAFSQGGDWIGGRHSTDAAPKMIRKIMNAYLLRPDRRFSFAGRMNEDVTTYTNLGNRGRIFFTYMPICLNQQPMQQNEGGMTDNYLEFGTYQKSFYSVMASPSCVSVSSMGEQHQRIHHRVSWQNAVPKILSEKHRKADS